MCIRDSTHAVPPDPGISLPAPYHYRGVLCVSASRTTALEAFALMDAERVSALGICDDEYKIVANVSISDLRGITPTNIHRLSLNIERIPETAARQFLLWPRDVR